MSSDFDMDEINQIFFEETQEGLDVMETGLLGLEDGEADIEVMNDIFRAAHSIKGGAGTFGFMEVSEFTHGVETLLDEMRSAERPVTSDSVQLLLKSVDRLREMMAELQDGGEIDIAKNDQLQNEISSMLDNDVSASDHEEAQNEEEQESGFVIVDETQLESDSEEHSKSSIWAIEFSPHLEMLKKGNDPLRIITELETLGYLTVEADISGLPELHNYTADSCYLRWVMKLEGEVSKEEILEVFDWVLEDCELEVTEQLDWVPPSNSLADSDIDKDQVQQSDSISKSPEVSLNKNTDKDVTPKKSEKQTTPAKSPAKNAIKESSSIRVSIEKVDSLINLVGELVITQSMLKRFGGESNFDELQDLGDGLNQLERYTRELQESVMEIRMLPIKFSFSRFPRLVHDISNNLGKQVELELIGEQTELDKTVLEKISDPLVHLVRNSLDHGIEDPETRERHGKSKTGKLTLSASQEGGNIVIRVIDDGAGINKEKLLAKAKEKGLVGEDEQLSEDRINNLIFHPGLSSVEKVSDLSGRGVGMDVVRRNIKDLGGRVEVQSEVGVGTSLTIRLPLTLAILDGQLVRVGEETYIISLLSIVETILINANQLNNIAGKFDVFQVRGEYIPVVWLKELLQNDVKSVSDQDGLLVIVEADGRRVGIFVDELLDQQQVVIKSLEDNYRQIDGVSGATILGDGTVALILDIPGLLQDCLTNFDPSIANNQHAA